jgi:hypothetical protein
MKRKSHDTILLSGCLLVLGASFILLMIVLLGLINPVHALLSMFAILIPVFFIFYGVIGFLIPIALGVPLLKYADVQGTASAIYATSYFLLVAILIAAAGLIHDHSAFPMAVFFMALGVLALLSYYSLLRHKISA